MPVTIFGSIAIASGLLANQPKSENCQSSTNAAFIPINRGGSPQEIAQTVV